MKISCPATYPTRQGGFRKGDLVKVGPHKARVASARTNFSDGQTRIASAFSQIRFQWQMTFRQRLYCIQWRTPTQYTNYVSAVNQTFLLRLVHLIQTAYTQDIIHHRHCTPRIQDIVNRIPSLVVKCQSFLRLLLCLLCFAFPCVDLLETYIC